MKIEHKLTSSFIHYYVSRDSNIDIENKEVILFIHPAFVDHHVFDEQVNYFATDYKVICLDLLGHGLSKGFKTSERIHNTSKHINEILELEDISKVHLVGVSIGSLLAQDFANQHTEKVASFCSLGGYDIDNYDSSMEKEQRKQQISFMIKALFSIKSFSKSNAKVSTYTSEAQTKFYHMNTLFKRRSFVHMTTLGYIMNKNRIIHQFPVLIMYGEYDNEFAISLSKSWHLSKKGSQLACIKDSGHCANMDNPIEFNLLLANFLIGQLKTSYDQN